MADRDTDQVVLTGVLNYRPSVRRTSQGKSVCEFEITQTIFGTERHRLKVTAWGSEAEWVATLPSGTPVAIVGTIRARERTSQAGNPYTVLEVVANAVYRKDAVAALPEEGVGPGTFSPDVPF